MRSAIMGTRKGIHIFGYYVVSINATPFHIILVLCALNSEKLKSQTEPYFRLF